MPNRKMPKNYGKKIKKGTIKRLFRYISKKYLMAFIAVIVCILVSSLANIKGSLFLETLIDDYIEPLLVEPNPVFSRTIKSNFNNGINIFSWNNRIISI